MKGKRREPHPTTARANQSSTCSNPEKTDSKAGSSVLIDCVDIMWYAYGSLTMYGRSSGTIKGGVSMKSYDGSSGTTAPTLRNPEKGGVSS